MTQTLTVVHRVALARFSGCPALFIIYLVNRAVELCSLSSMCRIDTKLAFLLNTCEISTWYRRGVVDIRGRRDFSRFDPSPGEAPL